MDEFDAAVAAFFRATHQPAPTFDAPTGKDAQDDEITRLVQQLSEWAVVNFPGETPG